MAGPTRPTEATMFKRHSCSLGGSMFSRSQAQRFQMSRTGMLPDGLWSLPNVPLSMIRCFLFFQFFFFPAASHLYRNLGLEPRNPTDPIDGIDRVTLSSMRRRPLLFLWVSWSLPLRLFSDCISLCPNASDAHGVYPHMRALLQIRRSG